MSDFPEIRIDVGIDESSISSSYDKIIAKTKSLESVIQSAMSKLSSSGGGALAVKSFEKSIEDVTKMFNSLRREMSEQLSFSVGADTSKITSDFAEARSGVLSSLANMEESIQQSAVSGEINLTRLTDAVSLTQESLANLGSNAFASESAMRELSESFGSLGNSVESISAISEVGNELESSLRGIASVTDEVSDNANQLGDSLDDVSDNLRDTNKQSENTSKGLKNLGDSSDIASNAISSLVKKLLLLVSVDKLKDLAFDSVELSSSLVELKNVTDTVFGDSASLIEDFADSSIESFGLAEVSAKEYASTIGAILGATGLKDTIGSEALALMSVNLTKVTADMSSFRNMGFDEVFTKIKSAITGETEAIKSLGVALYDADMQEYMLRNSIDGAWASLDNNTKILLRYNKIMEDTSFVQGDFKKTSDTFANSTRVLQERWTELLTLWGNYLIPVIAPAINVLGDLLAILASVTTQMAQLFGWSDYQIISDSVVSNTASMSDYLASGVSEADDLTSSVKAAGAQAKKSLAPFSELNILSSSKSGSSGVGGGNGGSTGSGGAKVDIANPYADSKTLSYLDELHEKLDKLKISNKAKKIVDFLKGIWDFLGKIAPLAEGALVGILSYTILKKLASGWESLVGKAGNLKKIFSGDFTGDTSTKLAKLAIAAGVATAEFKLLEAVFDKFVLDKFNKETGQLEMTFGDIAIAIGVVVGVVGVASAALYGLLGPVGLLVGGFVAVLAGIKAYTEYQDTVFQSSLDRNLGGTIAFSDALDTLLDKNFSALSTSLTELETSISGLNTQKASLDEVVTSFGQLLVTAQGLGGSLEGLPERLQALGDSVSSQAEAFASANYEWAVYQVMISNLGETDKADAIQTLTDKYNNNIASIQSFSQALQDAGVDGQITSDELANLGDSLKLISDLSGSAVVDYGVTIETGDIDFSNLDEVNTKLTEFNTTMSELESRYLQDRQDFIAKQVESGLSTVDAEQLFNSSAYTEAYKTGLQSIKEQLAAFLIETQEGFGDLMLEVGSKVDMEAVKEVFEGINNSIVEVMSDLGSAGATVPELTGFSDSMMTALNNASADFDAKVREAYPDGIFRSAMLFLDGISYEEGVSAITGWGTDFVLGYATGLEDQGANNRAITAATDMVTNSLSSVQETQDSHSPAETTRLLGVDFASGYALGMEESVELVSTSSSLLVDTAIFEVTSKAPEALLAGQALITAISDGFTLGQGGLETSLKSVLDSMSDILNKWVSNLASSFSSIGTSLSSIKSSGDISTSASMINNIKIPKLATGAVIQPNSEFISILGDQKSGVNIESPLATMVDAFTRALDNRGGSGFNGVIQIPVYVDGELNSMQVIDTQELERYRSNGR